MTNDRKGYEYTASSKSGVRQGRATGRPETYSNRMSAGNKGNEHIARGFADTGNGTDPSRYKNAQRNSTPQGSTVSRRTSQGINAGGKSHSNAKPSHAASKALTTGGERSLANPTAKKGLTEYWKRVFTLTPSEKKHNEVVPRVIEGYDYVFLIIVLVLLAFGSIMVYSASYVYAKSRYGDSYYIITRQAIFMVIGFVGMIVAMRVTPDTYKRFAPLIFLVCFFLLCLVPIPGIGVEKKGARRWLNIGIDFQPSEAMKFGLAIMLAWYFDRYQKRIRDHENFWRASAFGVFFPYVIVGLTCFLIVLEKHLSGTVIMFMIGTVIIFAGGAVKRWIFGIFGAGGVALLLLGLFTDYTKRRFDLWLHPEEYPLEGGWQTLQGLYAIGSGGFFGVGIGESRQKHMYVSEPQNDFIFTIVCEELGFVGAVAVILLFMLFIYRGMVIAMRAPDTFSSLLVIGIVGKVAIQAILNIAVVTGSIPNTGISLPFFSYGGTSLCILMAEMGVVLSVSRYSRQRK